LKLMIFPILCLTLMAARGVAAAFGDNFDKRWNYAAAAIWLVLLLTGIAASTFFGSAMGSVPFNLPSGASAQTVTEAIVEIGASLVPASLLGLAVCGIAYMHAQQRLTRKFALAAILLAIGGTLLANAYSLPRRAAPPDFFNRPTYLAQR